VPLPYNNVSIDTMLAFLFCKQQPSEGSGSKAFWWLICFLPFAECKEKPRQRNIQAYYALRSYWIQTGHVVFRLRIIENLILH